MSTSEKNVSADSSAKLLSPSALCHVVLRTTPENYGRMVDFYLTLLGARVTHASPRLTFLTYDDEHHRLAIVNLADLKPRDKTVGLGHIAFGFNTLAELATSYEQKKTKGILPYWAVNHGMSTSMYYRDPDGNELEMQVDNYDTPAEAIEFMASSKFKQNPVGVEYDPEEFVRRVRSGEDEKVVKLGLA